MIKRHPFIIFCLVISILIGMVVVFIQSQQFANNIRRLIASRVSPVLGINLDFTELSVRYFPPGLSVHQPKISLRKENKLGLSEGCKITASRIDLNFKPIQMFTGSVRVNEILIVDGDINIVFDKDQIKTKQKSKKKETISLRWDELFQIHADSVGLKNTKIRIQSQIPAVTAEFNANQFLLSQWYGRGGVGYEVAFDIQNLNTTLPKEWELAKNIQDLSGRLNVNSLGLIVDHLHLGFAGGALDVAGKLEGNVMDASSLPFESTFSLGGDLAKLKLPLPVEAQGQISAKGKAEGNLLKIADTLKSQITLQGKTLKVSQWKFDALQSEGSFFLKGGVPEVHLDQLEISSDEKERINGIPGSGGRIAVTGIKWKYGVQEPIKVKSKVTRAHIHWLAAPVQKQIFPLDLRVSGEINSDVLFSSGKNFEIKNELNLEVEKFQLDNQKLAQIKPLRKILSIPKVRLNGNARLNSRGIHFDAVHLGIKETKLKVDGGIDFKEGFDFSAHGSAHLEEIEHIAEIKIRGKGSLDAHIHGTTQRLFLDFMPNIDDAEYLGLHLGKVRGTLTLDEDPSHLIFTNLSGENGKTKYIANGLIDLKATPETIQLRIDVPTGEVQDVIHILENKVKDISWFPWTATGNVSGVVAISGYLNENGVQIKADCAGMDLDYKGERFKRVILSGGLDQDRYYVDSMRAIKKAGRLNGWISFRPKSTTNAEEALSWSLVSEEMGLVDIDHLSKIDVPLKGAIEIVSRGEEKKGFIESETTVKLKSVTIRGIPIPSSEVAIQTSQGTLSTQAELQGGQGSLGLNYTLKEDQPSSLKFDLKRFDFSHFLLMINPRLIQDQELQAYVSGEVDLQFRSGKIELGSGKLGVSEYVIQKKNVRFNLDKPGEFPIKNGTFRVDQLVLNGKDSRLKIALNSSQAEVAGLITGSIGLGMAEFFTPVVQDARGEAKIDLSMTGYLKKPEFIGKINLAGGSFRVAGTDLVFENVMSQIQVRQNHIIIKNADADLASGRVLAKGNIDLFSDRVPSIQLTGTLVDNKIKVFPFQFVKIRGEVHVHGDELPYLVDGKVLVDSALSREKVLSQRKNVSGKDRFSPPTTLLNEGNLPIFKLNIETKADKNVLIQNDLFDAELKGNLRIVNTLESPGIIGNAEIIQGKMSFKDRVFQIQSGKAEFDNPSVIDPLFNMVGVTEVNRTKIQLLASGRLEKYKIELSSNPVLSEAEILSILALGMSNDDFQRMRAGDRRAYEQGEAASLLLNTLDFNRDIQKRTGFQIQLDEATNSQLGTSLFRPRNDLDSTSAPRIVVRRKLGRKLDLSLGSTVGVGATNQRQVMTEYRFTPAFSLLGVWDYIEGIDSKNTDQTSYGVDFKLQKRFK